MNSLLPMQDIINSNTITVCKTVTLPRENQTQKAAREAVANWMIQNGYPTGHGDTLDDLLKELVTWAREQGALDR